MTSALLDTCALAKVVVEEAESAALTRWLDEREEWTRLICGLAVVVAVLEGLDVVPVTEPVLHQAASLPQTYLRTLDAIHLVTAVAVDTTRPGRRVSTSKRPGEAPRP